MITKWMQSTIVEAALKSEEARMRLATVYVAGQVKRLINRGNPTGKNPALPGEPPKKVSGGLFGSIFTQVVRSGMQVVGVVGSNKKYARRLELGFTGRDSAGRMYHQKPRPYLRPGLANSSDKVGSILGVKK